jgi:hypothetical protein
LVLDHIDGGGTAHKKELKKVSSAYYRWVIKEGYPDGFRVLCHNCNIKVHLEKIRSSEKHLSPIPKIVIVNGKEYVKYRYKEALASDKYKAGLKLSVMKYYSGGIPKCACCPVDDIDVLAIDHIEGGGRKHRKEIGTAGGGAEFYKWLIKQGFPSGYQVLCHNCNFAKGAHGVCHHKAV